MYKESDSDSHVVSFTNNQGENGVTNKTINAPASGIYKTQDHIQKRSQALRNMLDSENTVLPSAW